MSDYCDDCGNTDPECPLTRPATREEKIVRSGIYERAEEAYAAAKQRGWVGLRVTRDDIIRMAREAGYSDSQDWSVLVRFAALVAAPLEEQIERTEKMLDDQYKMGMEAEREACAKVCEKQYKFGLPHGEVYAKLIRARGEEK